MSWRDWLWLLILGAIWGSSFTFNEVIIAAVEPITASLFRVGIAAMGAWGFVLMMRKDIKVSRTMLLLLLVTGALNFAIPFAIFPLVQDQLTSGEAAIGNAFTPLMFVIVSHFWVANRFWGAGEKATKRRVLGVILGLIGVGLLSLPKLLNGANAEFGAMMLLLIAPLCYAIGSNMSAAFRQISPMVTSAYTLSGATLACLPIALIFETIPLSYTPIQIISFLALGLVGTAFAFQIMYMLLPRVGPTRFSTVTLIAPLFTLIFGALFLSETIELVQILGMLTIFSGLAMINFDGKKLSA